VSDLRPHDSDDPPSNGKGPATTVRRDPRRRLVLGALLLLTLAAALTAWRAREQAERPDDLLGESADAPVPALDLPRAGDRAVVLAFPRWDGNGWINEDRRVVSRGQPGEDLLALMESLCAGPESGRAISALPRGTRALSAFVDPGQGSAVVDFSRELVVGHPGGSAAEAATLVSILRTVAVNFPQITACTILVEGQQVGTLAGHLDLTHPFTPRRWL
jgi:hypothetical protein